MRWEEEGRIANLADFCYEKGEVNPMSIADPLAQWPRSVADKLLKIGLDCTGRHTGSLGCVVCVSHTLFLLWL